MRVTKNSMAKISQYIVIKKGGGYYPKYTSRMTVNSPSLQSNEIAVKVSIEVPDEIFDKPALTAEIVVPKEAVSKPVISADVIDNVQDIIKQNTGFEVKLEVVEHDSDNEEQE